MNLNFEYRKQFWLAVLSASLAVLPLQAQVVINEIFYNAPDDVDDLQWIELYNNSDNAADLGGWTIDDGKLYAFAQGAALPPKAFLVLALETNRFREYYDAPPQGTLKRALKRNGERLLLKDAAGKLIDLTGYKDRAPWPTSADGYSASLERICPSSNGDTADNWAASPLPATAKPSGTPGKQNARFSSALPPVLRLEAPPSDCGPAQEIPISVTVQGNAKSVELLYQIVGVGKATEAAIAMKPESGARYRAAIPPQKSGVLVRYRVKAVGPNGSTRFAPDEQDLRPTHSLYVHEPWEKANVSFSLILTSGPDKPGPAPERPNFGGFAPPGGGMQFSGRGPLPNFAGFGQQGDKPRRPVRGGSTMVYVDQKKGVTTVFDHISTVPRNNNRGFNVFFHKDHTLGGMSSVNVVYEGSEWSLLAEALSYDVYHRAGCPAPKTEFTRVWVDGKSVGHHLIVERVNRSFLRRNKIDEGGNLYKLLWMGRDPISQHEKQTHKKAGHKDLLALLDQLDSTKANPQQQWEIIKSSFDVDAVAAYFAVNMVLSHWDGFFNNYFAYHDIERGKWNMFPWDQDKTWGYYDGLPDDQVFFDMPLTFGMEGDRPPGATGAARGSNGGPQRGAGPAGMMGGAMWWRPGGYFSRPLLANADFRKVFLARTAQVLRDVYTEDRYSPVIDSLVKQLEPDAVIRASLRGEDAGKGKKLLLRDAELLKRHLVKRREFLLAQPELAAQGAQQK